MNWLKNKIKSLLKGEKSVKLTLVTPPANECLTPYIGLLQLASCMEGLCEVKIVDLNFFIKDNKNVTPEQLLVEIEATEPDILGISARCDNYPFVISLAKIYKEKYAKTKIILGGPQASATAEPTLKAFPFIDAIAIGEGEETLKEIIRAYKQDKNLANVKGLAFREKDNVIINALREPILDLDDLPLPAYSLVKPLTSYSRLGGTVTTAYIVTSRGCPFQCSYCNTSKFWNKKIRYRSIRSMMQEIDLLKETQGIAFVSISDDIFTCNKKRVEEFCSEIKKRGLSWNCSARIDTVDITLLKKMADAGCKSIFYGIESGSEKILKAIKKGPKFTPKLIRKIVKETIEAGINVTASFIVGFPEEEKDDLEQTKKLAEELTEMGAETQGHILCPLPQTEIYENNKNRMESGKLLSNIAYFALPKEIGEYFCKESEGIINSNPEIFSPYYLIKTKINPEEIRKYSLYITSLQQKLQKKEINLGFGL